MERNESDLVTLFKCCSSAHFFFLWTLIRRQLSSTGLLDAQSPYGAGGLAPAALMLQHMRTSAKQSSDFLKPLGMTSTHRKYDNRICHNYLVYIYIYPCSKPSIRV